MTNPLVTANPLKFKLRIVWGLETKQKLVAEFCDCTWIPRAGEIMVLPIEGADEFGCCQNWHKYKVENVAYDFQNQITRVICKSVSPTTHSFNLKQIPEVPLTDIQVRSLQKLESEVEMQELLREAKDFYER